MDVPPTAVVSVGTCLVTYLAGFNMFQSEIHPDLTGALFVALVVLMADKVRINLQILNRLWMFPIAMAIYYALSQVAMFFVWQPVWTLGESFIDVIFSSKIVYGFYEKFPRFVVFMRKQSLALCKLLLMIFTTYKTICLYQDMNVSRKHGRGLHEDALRGLLAQTRAPRGRRRKRH